jgi:UDP-N-acetylglucosamine 2-epimerase (non-hydrolysing)
LNAIEENGLQGILGANKTIKCKPLLSYRENLCLMSGAGVVLTDSGGIHEETSYWGIPCLTLRENTERPITVTLGTSRLVGNDPKKVMLGFQDVVKGKWPKGNPILLWDGKTGEGIVKILGDKLT